jgi:flagellar FliL protein
MSKAAKTVSSDAPEKAAGRGGKGKLIMAGVAVLTLAGAGAGAWFAGLLPGHGAPAAKAKPADTSGKPIFIDVPELVANLNAGGRRVSYIKLHAKLEIERAEDQAGVVAVMPRLQDMFQTYLREMRPEELRGSAGTWRLREELLARANIAASPAQISDVLFTDMLVQ